MTEPSSGDAPAAQRAVPRRELLEGPEGILADRKARLVLARGQEIVLSRQAFDLLVVLLEHRGRVVTHDELAQRIWQFSDARGSSFVQTALYRLRSSLKDAGVDPRVIQSVRGVGYSIGRGDRSTPMKSRDALEATVRASAVPMLVVDRSGQIVLANDAASARLGYSIPELEALPPGALTPSGLRDGRSDALRRLLDGEKVYFPDTLVRRSDGTYWKIDAFASPIWVTAQVTGILIEFWHPVVRDAAVVIS